MAEPKTKGMVALVPTAADADRLAVDGGLPVDELHLTLLFLGDAADWDDDARVALIDALGTFAGSGVVDGDGFALSAFNPGSDDRETAIVLGVGGQAIDDFHTAVVDAAPADNLPDQHAPWVAHTSLIYTDDLAMLADLVDRTGPVTFDRLRIAFADTVTDIPLSAASAAANRLTDRRNAVDRRDRLKTARPMARLREGHTDWYRIENKAADSAAIYLYEEIGYWGVTAQDFVRDLREVTAKKIDLHINTPGGEVFDAIAIYQALRDHPAEITVHIDSLAASSGSFIAMAGDKRLISPHGTIMIHEAWGMCIGDAADMTKMADELGRLSGTIASIYASRAGGDVADWRALMHEETWFSAQEALDAGLVHEIKPDADKSADTAATNRWDLSIFNFAGRDAAPPPRIPQPVATVTEPAAEPPPPDPLNTPDAPPTPPDPGGVPVSPAAEPDPTEPKEERVSDDIRSLLGVPDDADDDAVKAAIEELKNKAETPTPDPEQAAAATKAAEENNELRKEVEVLASQVKSVTTELAETKAEKAASVKASVLDAAQKQGKFTPADRAQWEKDYDDAPAAVTRILASIAPGTAVPVAAAGFTGGDEVDTDTDWDAAMARLDGPAATNSKGA